MTAAPKVPAAGALPARAQPPTVPWGSAPPPRILLYGGTFDPPHLGHLNNLRAAMAAVRPDRVGLPDGSTAPNAQGRTYAQLADGEKDAISHRGRAMAAMAEALPQILAGA